jgi:hypothetical protein
MGEGVRSHFSGGGKGLNEDVAKNEGGRRGQTAHLSGRVLLLFNVHILPGGYRLHTKRATWRPGGGGHSNLCVPLCSGLWFPYTVFVVCPCLVSTTLSRSLLTVVTQANCGRRV